MDTPTNKINEAAGRSIATFTQLVGLSRTAFYQIAPECLPECIKFGTKTIVIEQPAAWIERMRQRGGVVKTKQRDKSAA